MLCGDNLNISQKTRHTRRNKDKKQLNYFNTMAVKNRVPFFPSSITNRAASYDEEIHHISVYLPTEQDDAALRADFKLVVFKASSYCKD